MTYADFNEELKCSYTYNTQSFASLIGESQLPVLGLKASNLLTERQMRKLREIRKRHLKKEQREKFITD